MWLASRAWDRGTGAAYLSLLTLLFKQLLLQRMPLQHLPRLPPPCRPQPERTTTRHSANEQGDRLTLRANSRSSSSAGCGSPGDSPSPAARFKSRTRHSPGPVAAKKGAPPLRGACRARGAREPDARGRVGAQRAAGVEAGASAAAAEAIVVQLTDLDGHPRSAAPLQRVAVRREGQWVGWDLPQPPGCPLAEVGDPPLRPQRA